MEPDIDRKDEPVKAHEGLEALEADAIDGLTQAELDVIEGLTESLAQLEHARIAINLCRRTAVQLTNVEQVSDRVWNALNNVMARAFNDILRSWPQEP